ncbi:DUF2752 domain-containing protein [Williamsia sp. CHRR-6]|nr:DUF2752 domain-containing protein [Williamsia sp. CHRR-6]
MRALAAPAGVAAVAAGSCVGIWLADPTTPGGVIPVCPTKALLGIDCPGCGSMRMIYSLLHADIGAALRYNALGLVAVVLLVVSYIGWVLARFGVARLPRWQDRRWAPMLVLIAVIGWFVVRNLPFAPFTGLRV